MKKLTTLLALGAIALFVGSGCGKKETSAAPQVNGVTVDVPKLNEAFANASPELKGTVTQVGFSVRYGKYEEALMNLDKLANDPSLTEPQKKVVNEVLEQAKKLATTAPPPAQ